jgi:hypothetical protein
MPAVSEKQKKFMDAVAHNKGFAKKVGVPQSVGAEISDKSKGMKFGSGSTQTRTDRQKLNKPKTDHGQTALFKQGGTMATKKMNEGFMAMIAKKKAGAKAEMPMKKMAAGGSASARADGIATKGKTKGKMLAKGGMSKAKC